MSVITDQKILDLGDRDLDAQAHVYRMGWEIVDFGETGGTTAVAASRSIYDLDIFPTKGRYRIRKLDGGRELPYFPTYCGTTTECDSNVNLLLGELGLIRQVGETNRQATERCVRVMRDAAESQ